MDWLDYVLVKERRLFRKLENNYTNKELTNFYQARNTQDREVARARVLAKRLEFLAYWIQEQ